MSPRFLRVSVVTLLALAPASAAQNAVSLVETGDAISGVGNVTDIVALAVNNSGDWVVKVDTDNPQVDFDEVILKNDATFLQEGDQVALPPIAFIDTFGALTLSSQNSGSWRHGLEGSVFSHEDSGIYFDDFLLIQESQVSGAPEFNPGAQYIELHEATKLNDNYKIVFSSVIDDESSVFQALVLVTTDSSGNLQAEAALAEQGEVLAGQTEAVEFFPVLPTHFAFNDLDDLMFTANLEGNPATDAVVYVNDVLIAQTGSPSPVVGRNWADLDGPSVDLNNHRDYVVRGVLSGSAASDGLIMKNGVKFVQEGDSLPDIAPFQIDDLKEGPVELADNGDVLWYGEWNSNDVDRDQGLFVNDSLIVEEGQTSIEGTVVFGFGTDPQDLSISPNGRYVIFRARLEGGTWGAYLLDLGPQASTTPRNGTGENELCYASTGLPLLGGTWTSQIDASHHAGAGLTLIVGYEAPIEPALFAAGELLIDLGTSQLASSVAPSGGGVASHDIALPNDSALAGFVVYTQGAILGGGLELCNAIDVWLGD